MCHCNGLNFLSCLLVACYLLLASYLIASSMMWVAVCCTVQAVVTVVIVVTVASGVEQCSENLVNNTTSFQSWQPQGKCE